MDTHTDTERTTPIVEFRKFLQDHPKHAKILRRAIEVEEKKANEPNWLGWEWYEVRAYPAQLVKLVIEGAIKVNFKSNTSTCYLLVDRDMAKSALKATS
jgi:hypothetical protein